VFTRRLSDPVSSNASDEALLIRFVNSEAGVEHQTEEMRRAIDDSDTITVLSQDEADAVWEEVADFDQRAVRVRLSVPIAAVAAEFENAFLAHPDCVATADIGTGIIRMAFDANEESAVDSIKRLRASAAAANGSLVIEKASPEARRAADVWGEIGSTAELMRSIKARFDPQSLLSPGRFVLGL
jgi:glycolate oxidase FAD binding subunit